MGTAPRGPRGEPRGNPHGDPRRDAPRESPVGTPRGPRGDSCAPRGRRAAGGKRAYTNFSAYLRLPALTQIFELARILQGRGAASHPRLPICNIPALFAQRGLRQEGLWGPRGGCTDRVGGGPVGTVRAGGASGGFMGVLEAILGTLGCFWAYLGLKGGVLGKKGGGRGEWQLGMAKSHGKTRFKILWQNDPQPFFWQAPGRQKTGAVPGT